ARTGEVLHTLDLGPKGEVANCAPVFAPEGHRVMIQAREEVQVWDILSGARITTFPVAGVMESLRVSPDGKLVLTAHDKAQVWEAASGEPITPPLDKFLTYWTTAL